MKKWILLPCLAAVLACEAPKESAESSLALTVTPRLGRPCRTTSFFVDAPLSQAAPADTFRVQLQNDLRASLPAQLGWFCEANDAPCLGAHANASAYVVSVLPARTANDGHRRFFRAYFSLDGLEPLEVREHEQCSAVKALREAVGRLSGAPAYEEVCPATGGCIADGTLYSGIRVGRECAASLMGAEAVMGAPGSDTETWHRTRIGAHLLSPVTSASSIHVALLDTGIDPSMNAALGVSTAKDYVATGPVPGEETAGLHQHGTKMAILMRQIMGPAPKLHSYRVLDGQGVATIGSFARSFDRVVHDTAFNNQTLIINASLGFPPELLRRSVLSGADQCRTIEDGAGEAVRFVASVARQRSDAGLQKVIVIASAGNRATSGSVDAEFFTGAELAGTGPDPCPGTPSSAPLFAPAEYGRAKTCRDGATLPPLSMPIGAVDERERPMALAIADSETALVAPGEHVYVSHPAGEKNDEELVCAEGLVGDPQRGKYPAVLTGSSVSAALTSASAARVQAELALRSGATATLDWRRLSRLLYVSGTPLCRNNTAGEPVHRLSVDRAVAAARCPAVIAKCATGGSVTADLDHALFATLDCKDALAACAGLGPTNCPAAGGELAWPPALITAVGCPAGTDPAQCLEPNECREDCVGCSTLDPPPNAKLLDSYSLGAIGPAPAGPGGCPECLAMLELSTGLLDLYIEISRELPASTRFVSAQVSLSNAWGERLTEDLGEHTDLASWRPGKVVVLKDIPFVLGNPTHWMQADAVLDVDVTQDGRAPFHQRSPLRFKAN